MLSRSKLNSIETNLSENLTNSEIYSSHENSMTKVNKEKEYRWLKEIIRILNSQRSDTEKINLIEEGKKISIDEVIKRNEIVKKV